MKIFANISGRLHINGYNMSVFMLSFLLALSVWLIHNLSLKYTDTVAINILVKSNIDGYSQTSKRPVTIYARCRTTGFNLIRLKYHRQAVKEVFFDPSHIEKVENGTFYIKATSFPSYYKEIFGEELSIESLITTKLEPVFTRENSKKVPVQLLADLSYKSQYMLNGRVKLKPDSITIYGNPNDIINIKSLKTNTIKHYNIDRDINALVEIQALPNIRYSLNKVSYSIPVTRYIEIQQNDVKIHIRNKPNNCNLSIFPSYVDISYFCAFPLTVDPTEQVKVYIDYNDFQNSINGRCVPILSNLPSSVINYSIEPQIFECVEN